MDTIWRDGLDLGAESGWRAACARLGLDAAAAALVDAPETKERLRANTEEAIAAGLFGVPTLRVGDELFWGLDALPMALAFLDNPALFQSGELQRVGTLDASSSRVPLPSGTPR
jgi:2-hydroxychromene-2-carboxylate isomerase